MRNKLIKSLIILIMIVILSSIMTIAYAETNSFSFTVNPTEVTAEVGDTITVDLGIADIDQSSDGITSVQGELAYDENIFENVEISTSVNNWSVQLNQLNESSRKGKFVISNLSSVKSTQNVAQLKATIKSTANVSSATIYLNNVYSSYGTTDTAKTDKTITVKINKTASAVTRKQYSKWCC